MFSPRARRSTSKARGSRRRKRTQDRDQSPPSPGSPGSPASPGSPWARPPQRRLREMLSCPPRPVVKGLLAELTQAVFFTDPRYGNRNDLEQFDSDGRDIEGVYRIDGPGQVTRILEAVVWRLLHALADDALQLGIDLEPRNRFGHWWIGLCDVQQRRGHGRLASEW